MFTECQYFNLFPNQFTNGFNHPHFFVKASTKCKMPAVKTCFTGVTRTVNKCAYLTAVSIT